MKEGSEMSALILIIILVVWGVNSYTPDSKKWERFYEQKAKYPDDMFKWYE